MNKRLFEILDEMNQLDAENKTFLVEVAPTFVRGQKVKAGSEIVMGATESAIYDIMNRKKIPILILVDKEEYFKRQKQL